MYAVRNIDRCTKDCLCLYVCPTGASDTENGQIDASKCIGCGACALSLIHILTPLLEAVNDIVEPLRRREQRDDYHVLCDTVEKQFERVVQLVD